MRPARLPSHTTAPVLAGIPRARPLARRIRRFRIRHPTLTGALVTALLGAGAWVIVSVTDGAGDAGAPSTTASAPAPVAARDLARGHLITDADLVVASSHPTGPAPAVDPVGRVVTAPVLAGEPIAAARVAPEGLDGVAALVGSGRRAVAIPTALPLPPLRVGDVVDVLAADDTALTTGIGVRIAAAAEVVAVDDQLTTVSVEPTEAVRVAGALAAGSVTLALIGAG